MTQNKNFMNAIAVEKGPIFKIVLCLEYLLFFRPIFCTEPLQCGCKIDLCMFSLECLIFYFAWRQFLAISKWSHFSNISCFCELFWIEQLQCVLETFLGCFFAFLIFDQKEPFCKGYSPSLLAIFGNFQNDLIFRIFAVFSDPILHRTTPMCHIETFLACCFCIFIF